MEKLEEEGIQVGRLTEATKSIHGAEMAKSGQTLNAAMALSKVNL